MNRRLVVGLASFLALCVAMVLPLEGLRAAGTLRPAHDDVSLGIRHVLLISVDGLHAVDLQRYVAVHPASAMAVLSRMGITYNEASTARPSDSFPGMTAQVTGGSPKTTGVYYDNSYDHSLYAPGTGCKGAPGTQVVYDESIDTNGDTATSPADINPAKLPLRKTATGCVPLYPHSYLRVNTVFEVLHAAGLRTAWADKHPAYDLLNGPSGKGIDDLFTPEITGQIIDYTTKEVLAQQNDARKVRAVLNEIAGMNSAGTMQVGTPAIFGMNFQAVSVGQKLQHNATNTGPDGYTDALATPSAELASGLNFVDRSLGQMVAALRARNLLASTAVIISAKHGQAPIDPHLLNKIDPAKIDNVVNSVSGFSAKHPLVAQDTQDDISLIWLTNGRKTAAAVAALDAAQKKALTATPPQVGLGIAQILAGPALIQRFGNPATDPRAPNIIVVPTQGVIYTTSQKRIAEHGGFNNDDTHVALLIANPSLRAASVQQPVATTQIAPTILALLGFSPRQLQAVRIEGTQVLPGF